MSDDEEENLVQVSHMVPEAHRDAASENTEWGGVSEAVREVYRILADGGSMSRIRLELQLRKIKNDRERLNDEISDLEEQVEHLKERESALEDRVAEAEERSDRFESLMDELDDALQSGERVFPEHGKVKRAASFGDLTPIEVVELLKERNPDVPTEQFTEKGTSDDWRTS